MEILVSFITTRFSELKKFWKRNSQHQKKGKFKGTEKVFDVNLGGKIILLDWKDKKIIKQKNIKTPAGFDFNKDEIYLCNSGNNISVLDKKLNIKNSFSNKYLNDLHSLNITSKGEILLASTGIDCIVLLDNEGNLKWSWFATENGYEIDPKGRKRFIDKKLNHRQGKYPTLKQTTHLNSALDVGKTKYFDQTIYCSLFHQGKIIAIDKKTSKSREILKELRHQHSIYFMDEKILISDTENESIIIGNKNLGKIKKIKIKDVDWIQDATLLSNGNFLISDPNNNKIIEFNYKKGKVEGEMSFNKEWMIYQAKEVK